MAYNKINFLRKIAEINEIARKYYEPGRQDRNWRAVWRNHIHPRYHICYITFLKYINTDTDKAISKEISRLEGNTLFDDEK